MTNASFCLFICTFVFASNSGHFRINDFLLFFTPLLLLNYFLFNLFLFLQKNGGAKAPQPLPLRGPWLVTIVIKSQETGTSPGYYECGPGYFHWKIEEK